MISTPIANSQVTMEHLDDASDCCREAAETLAHIAKFNPSLKLTDLCMQLATMSNTLTALRASVHRDAYPTSIKMANSIFPMSQPSQLMPLW